MINKITPIWVNNWKK